MKRENEVKTEKKIGRNESKKEKWFEMNETEEK